MQPFPMRTGFVLAPPGALRPQRTLPSMARDTPPSRNNSTSRAARAPLHTPKRARTPSAPPSTRRVERAQIPPPLDLLASLAHAPVTPRFIDDKMASLSFLDTLPRVVPHVDRKPRRRPHGFWNDLANVERELVAVNAQLGRGGKKIVPRLSEINALGRGDLVAAISKHGGVKKVAEALHWGRGGKTRRAVATDAAVPDGAKSRQTRSKIPRRPKAYWDDVQRVQTEIGAFIDEYGVRGIMPTQKQFRSFGRADLVNAAQRHGGLRRIASNMGLKCRRAPKKISHWNDFQVVKETILEFSNHHCKGRMPTRDELCSKGESAVANAIVAHGGFPAVAKRCGLVARNTKDQGAPVTWDEKRLKMEILSFTMAYFPDLARSQRMPSERQLRKFGRNDLSYAVSKFGGFYRVSEMIGLSMKRHGPFSRSKSDLGKSTE